MKRQRSIDEKRFHRHMAKRTKGGAWCCLCGESTTSGVGLDWLDELNVDRGTILFVLCSLCMKTSYAEALTRMHRQAWARRQAAAPPEPITLFVKEGTR